MLPYAREDKQGRIKHKTKPKVYSRIKENLHKLPTLLLEIRTQEIWTEK